MKTKECPRCKKMRRSNGPVSYVWWHVQGHGHMCWKCYDDLEKSKPQSETTS